LGLIKPVVAGETLRRQSPGRATRDPPLGQVGFGTNAPAVATHRPTQPFAQAETDRIGQAAILETLYIS
jgi:hypothetical protein